MRCQLWIRYSRPNQALEADLRRMLGAPDCISPDGCIAFGFESEALALQHVASVRQVPGVEKVETNW